MAREHRQGRDRIENEADSEQALGNALASAMIEQATPGVFVGGKEIVGTETSQDPQTLNKIYTFWFNDGSAMVITGQFDITFAAPGTRIIPDSDTVEGSVIEDATPELPKGD